MTTYLSPVPPPAADVRIPKVTKDIYGMPSFITLLVANMEASVDWYTQGLDFISLFSLPGPDGTPVLVHLRRWHFQDVLVRPAPGPVELGNALVPTFSSVITQIDALHARASEHRGGAVTAPQDTPWNSRDFVATDPDGHTMVFTAARPPEDQDHRFSARIRERAQD